MIDSIKIDHFKSIHDQTIELGNLNIFIGANGSGKSNILEALGIISTAISGTVDNESIVRRGVRTGVPRLYKTSSLTERIHPHIRFTAEGFDCKYSVSINNPLDKPRPQWHFKTEDFIDSNGTDKSYGVRSKRNPAAGIMPSLSGDFLPNSSENKFVEYMKNYALYNPNTPVLRGTYPDIQSRYPVGLSGGNMADGLRDLLKEAVHKDKVHEAIYNVLGMFSWVKEIGVESYIGSLVSPNTPRQNKTIVFEDMFMAKNHSSLTASDASEGVLYALFLAVLCLTEEGPPIFAIDNIDQALNPRLAKALIREISRWFDEIIPEKQLLCTAHNPSILDGIDHENDNVRVFIVDRNSIGATTIKPLKITEEFIKKSKDMNMPLSRMWVEGYLGGGVPNV